MATKPTKSTELEIAPLSETLARFKERTLEIVAENNMAVTAEMVMRGMQENILSAANADDILAVMENGSQGIDDWTDRPIEILSVAVLGSADQYKSANGLDVYASVEFVDLETGSKQTLTTGGRILCTALIRLQEVGAYPLRGVFVSQVTSANRTVHKFRRLTAMEQRAVENHAGPEF